MLLSARLLTITLIRIHRNKDPQKRFNGLTAGEMRREALKGNIKSCPIAPNHRIERYWQKIYEKKIKEAKKVLS